MPQIPIRWSDNTAQLTQRLREGLGTIEATKASVEKLVKAFQAEGLIANAHKWTAAIREMGDVSKLSADQQARAFRIISDAIGALERQGRPVPAQMRTLAKELKTAQQATQDWTTWLSKANNLLGTLGIGLSIGAAVGFAKSIFEDADSLVRLSDQTGISIDRLQMFRDVGRDVGVSMEQIGGAVSKMSIGVGEGSEKAASGLAKLGLNITDIRAMAPDAAFVAIANAVSQMKDPTDQATVAFEIFGRKGVELLPVLKKGFQDAADSATRMSAETVRALDAAGDKAATFWQDVKNSAALYVVDMGKAATATTDVTDASNLLRAAGSVMFTPMVAAAADAVAQLTGLKEIFESTTSAAERLASSMPKPRKDVAAPYAVPRSDAAGVQRSAAEIDAATQQQIADAKRMTEEIVRAAAATRKWQTEIYLAENGFKDLGEAAMYGMRAYIQGLDEIEASGGIGNLLDFGKVEGAPEFTLDMGLAALSVEELGRKGLQASARLKAMGITIGGLPNVTSQAGAALKALRDEASRGSSVFDGMKASLKGLWAGMTGGNGLKGLFSNIGAGVTNALGSMLTGGISTAINAGISLLANGLKRLFGGPSAQELAGRKVTEQFEQQFASVADMIQKFSEARQKLGDTEAQANQTATQWAKELWDAEKQGGDAVQAVIDKIKESMDAAAEQASLLSEASSLYGPSSTDLQAAVEKARKIFDAMRAAGTYTQEELAKAQLAYQKALAATGDEAAKAWLAQQGQADEASAAGYETTAQLQEAADKAQKLYEYMRDSGQYSADQVADAFKKAQDAQDRALGKPLRSKALDDLQKQYDDLAKSVENEAPEEVMGSIETATRGQMDALKKQIDAASQTTTDANKDAMDSVQGDSADAANGMSEQFDRSAIEIAGSFKSTRTEAERTADAIDAAFKNLKYTIPVDFDVATPPAPPRPPGAATGGRVVPGGIQRFAAGGSVLNLPAFAAAPWPDTQLVWTSPGELIMNPLQQTRLTQTLVAAASLAHGVNAGRAAGGGDQRVDVHAHLTLDGRQVSSVVIRDVAQNNRGAGTNLRRALRAENS